MKHQPRLRTAALCLVMACAAACRSDTTAHSTSQGYAVRTYHDTAGNIDAIVARDGDSTIVAVPRMAIGRGNGITDDEVSCLKKCRDIEDLEKRLNCILACPVSKKFEVAMF